MSEHSDIANPAPPAAVFFDLDGTILDWQTGMEESWLAACEAHVDGPLVAAKLHEAIRLHRTWFWEDPERARRGRMDLDAASREIVTRAFADMGIESRDLARGVADDYRARRIAEIAPYPGAVETLEAFRRRGIPMALITNGDGRHQRRNIERYGLASYFDCIVIEGEFGVGKPDERVFHHALAAVAGAASTTWMVGDSLEADIAPAVALGMHAVWVDAERAGLPSAPLAQPHRIVQAIRELAPSAS